MATRSSQATGTDELMPPPGPVGSAPIEYVDSDASMQFPGSTELTRPPGLTGYSEPMILDESAAEPAQTSIQMKPPQLLELNGPIAPADHSGPLQPPEITGPGNPAELTQTFGLTNSTEPTQPVESVQPPEPMILDRPIGATELSGPTEPPQPQGSLSSAEPIAVIRPPQVSWPTDLPRPTDRIGPTQSFAPTGPIVPTNSFDPTPPLRPYRENGTRNRQVDLPSEGEAIQVKLPFAVTLGPPSVISSALTGATGKNYHLCFVLNCNNNRAQGCIDLDIWVCLGFSSSKFGGPTSNNFVRTLSPEWQACLLPTPFAPQFPPVDPLPTPAGFGSPLYIGGFLAKRPTFLVVRPVTVRLPRGRAFKRFNPPGFLSPEEMERIEEYTTQISALPLPIEPNRRDSIGGGGSGGAANAPGPNGNPGNFDESQAPPPEDVSSMSPDQPGGFTATTTMYATQSEEPKDIIILEDISSGSSEGSENELTVLEYARLFAPQSPTLQNAVNDYDAREQATRADRVMTWLNKVEGY